MNDQSLRRLLMETLTEDHLGLHELAGLLPEDSGTDIEIREQISQALLRCMDRGWIEAYQSEVELTNPPDALPQDDVALLIESKAAWKPQGNDTLRFLVTEAGEQALEDDDDDDEEEPEEEVDPTAFID